MISYDNEMNPQYILKEVIIFYWPETNYLYRQCQLISKYECNSLKF